jgi:hypothetical protein
MARTRSKGRSPRLNGLVAGPTTFVLCILAGLELWGVGIGLALLASAIVADGVHAAAPLLDERKARV